jgi:HD-like signal output (HDOD) protein
VIENERTLTGIIDALHADLGRAILERWRYPDDLVAVPAEHEDLARSPPGPDLADVVQVANFLAYRGTGEPKAAYDWTKLPSARRLRLGSGDEEGILAAALPGAAELASTLGNE